MNPPHRVLLLGYGSIGQGLTQPLMQHFQLRSKQIVIIAADGLGCDVAQHYGLQVRILPLCEDNYRHVLDSLLAKGDWLINVSVEVASSALVEWCQANQVLYLDTCVEPWAGGYVNPGKLASTTNYALRRQILNYSAAPATTAVIAHGANPGLVSHFVKAGLLDLAAIQGIASWTCWADLACQLDIKVVQIAERDSQHSDHALLPGVFANTWSVDGLMAEAWQCAELGWGTHEPQCPADAQQQDGNAIYLRQHGASVKVKSWVPAVGEQSAYLIAHHEAISIADLLTLPGVSGNGIYRPTVYFAYHPAHAAGASLEQWASHGYQQPLAKRVMREELQHGDDQLGVLLVFSGGAYWYGSTLALAEARQLAPHNNATSLQVVAGILGALAWMQQHPQQGVVEAENMDFEAILKIARPYLGEVSGVLTTWQPVADSQLAFADFLMSDTE